MAVRTVIDAQVVDAVRGLAWIVDEHGRRKLTSEGLYSRRKMTALVRRRRLPEASFGSVDRAMRLLGLSGVRRDKGIPTTIPAKDGKRAGDLLDRDFTAPAPNKVWATDFTYVRTWSGLVYVAFIIDVFAQPLVAWHVTTSKDTDLVMIPLPMAIWQRDRDGHPTVRGELICHSDAGLQYTSIRFTEHLELEGIHPSIGSVGDAYDNAPMETANRLYKTECIRTTVFHEGLPRRTLPHYRRRRVRNGRLSRLVQPATPPRHPWHDNSRGIRASPLRGPHPRAATRMRAAPNPGHFRLLPTVVAAGS